MFRLVQPMGVAFPMASGGGGAAAFSPSSIAGYARDWNFADATKLYTDIAHTTSVTADGDPIGAIVDGVGGAVYLVAPGDNTTRPTYETNIQNGLSVGRFDGSNDYLSGTITADASQTIFVIAKKTAAVGGTGKVVWSLNATGTRACLYTDSDSPSGTGYNYYASAADAETAIGGTPTDWNIIAMRYATVSDIKIYFNGGAAAASFDPHDNYSTATTLFLAAQSDTTLPGDYDIGRVLVYSAALSNTDLDSLFSYLGTLWNITVTPVS
jgi:hypothetical protein